MTAAADPRDVVERLRERQTGCDGLCDHQHRPRHLLLETEAADEIVRLRLALAAERGDAHYDYIEGGA